MNHPKHILMIVENLPLPSLRRTWQEALALRAAGYEVSTISPKGKGHDAAFETIDGIDVYRHGLPMEAGGGALGYAIEWGVALVCQLWLAIKIYRKNPFQVIHVGNPPDLMFLVGLCFKPFGVKFIFEHMDTNPELYEARFGKRGFFHSLLLFFEKCSFWLADASIAMNESYRQIAIQRGGMKAENVFIVKGVPDLSKFQRVTPDKTLKNGRSKVIGYVGVMGAQDGLDLLLKAVQHLAFERKYTDFQAVIVGDGTELIALKALAVDLKITDYVTFTGYLRGETLLSTLSTFDVGAIPDPSNVYTDKISMNKVFEYMTLGIPFVQFDLTEGRVAAGDACLYAENNDPKSLGDKLLEILQNDGLSQDLREKGLKLAAETLSWERERASLLAAYNKVFHDD